VETRSPVKHIVTPKRIQEWLEGGAKSPKEAMMKQRLSELLQNSLTNESGR
jgi:hypothetical protein